jgi:hypothetical protein
MRHLFVGCAAAVLLSGCPPPSPSLDVVVQGASHVAWAANNRILYTGEAPSNSTELFAYDPGLGSVESLGIYPGLASYLDIDATDRVLLGGIGGAYTFVKQDGTNPIAVVNLEDTTEGFTGLHVSSGGGQVALATLPPQPDLQVHLVSDGSLLEDNVDLEGDAVIADLDWSLDDAFIYYGVNLGVGNGVQIIRVAPDGMNRSVVWQGTSIASIDRFYLSHLGDEAVLSGRDAGNITSVWYLDLSNPGFVPVLIESEGGRWNRVQVAGGFSPDGERFLLEVEAPSGISVIIQRVP